VYCNRSPGWMLRHDKKTWQPITRNSASPLPLDSVTTAVCRRDVQCRRKILTRFRWCLEQRRLYSINPRDKGQETENMTNSTMGLLQGLPLKLRDEIYRHTIENFVSLEISSDVQGFGLQSLRRELPHCIRLNDQIMDEATNAYPYHT
jgi:hypothetical protein